MDSVTAKNGSDEAMSVEERKVYDRQIRLWGYDGQTRLKQNRILLIGMQGVGAEIAKNLILSGVNSITLMDHTEVSILDCCSQFLIPRDSQERNRAKASLAAAQKLNPNVIVTADTTPIEDKDDTFVAQFNLVIATECSPDTYRKISENCRKAEVKLFIADVYGLFGYFFQDVNFKHSLYGQVFPNDQNVVLVSTEKKGPSFPYYLTSALVKFHSSTNRKPNPDTSEEDIKELKSIITFKEDAQNTEAFDKYYSELFCELSPTASIVGAMVAQTAMNTIMKKPLDDQNVFFYDHIEHKGEFYLF